MKTALITGITGQDGSYLAELLLKKGYQVIGLVSQKYNIGWHNISHIKNNLVLENGDLLDRDSLVRIIKKHQPQEIYNLAGLTFIPASWDKPTLTLNINTLGLTRLLETVKKFNPKAHFFQASSAKIFGQPLESPQTETTPLKPQDPYSVSKAAAHLMVKAFRDKFSLFACSGIMYNHESERRGPEFVTRKITQAAAKIKLGLEKKLNLGNLEAQADWGYAPDYVQAMWLMLQQKKADDYIIASGKLHSVKDVCRIAFSHLKLNYQDFVTIDKAFYRPSHAKPPLGDATKANKVLNWQPQTNFETMIKKMVDHDLKELHG